MTLTPIPEDLKRWAQNYSQEYAKNNFTVLNYESNYALLLDVTYNALIAAFHFMDSRETMRWVRASEELPDPAEHWAANNKHQEGRIVYCRIGGIEKGIGYFYRAKNELWFQYSRIIPNNAEGFWEPIDTGIGMPDFDEIEWLYEGPAPIQ